MDVVLFALKGKCNLLQLRCIGFQRRTRVNANGINKTIMRKVISKPRKRLTLGAWMTDCSDLVGRGTWKFPIGTVNLIHSQS